MKILMTHRTQRDLFPAVETSTFASQTTLPTIDKIRFESSKANDEFSQNLDALLNEIQRHADKGEDYLATANR